MPKFEPYVTRPIEVFILLSLLGFEWIRQQFRELDRDSKYSWYAQIGLTVIALISNIVRAFFSKYNYPWAAAFVRPLMLVCLFRTIRQYTFRYLYVIKDSMPMVLFTLVYLCYFSWVFQKIFAGTLEGVQYMSTYPDAVFNMLVLLTTSNYPDVMLPAVQENRLYFFLFFTYLILGLFLILNLLLAIIYSNFKNHFESQIGNREEDRTKFLYEKFKYHADGEEHLDETKMYKYFVMIHAIVTKTD